MSVNVNRNVDDPFYRYKMPRLLAKVEGKGNGIKTVIVNMPEIAKALDRPPTYPTKYFGCELGAQTQVDSKNDRFIVNGEHDAEKLQHLLDGFIRKFVLCPECDNPETKLAVRKNEIGQSCAACGHATVLRYKDRLTTYIVKNPPGVDAESAEKKDKKDRRSKRAKPESPGSPAEQTPASHDVTDGFDNAFADEGSGGGSDNVDDEDWAVNPEDAAARQKELAAGMVGLTVNDDLERGVDERLDMFFSFLNQQLDKSTGLNDGKTIVAEAERLDIKDKAVLLLCKVFLNEDVCSQVKKYRNIFLRFTYENKRAQRYLLGGLEQLIIDHKDVLLPKTAHILKAFYDEDIVEEDAIMEWGEKASKKYVSKEDNKLIRAKAAPFLQWLKEAEEESGDDGDEDDDLQVVYDDDEVDEDDSGVRTGKQRGAVRYNTEDDGTSKKNKAVDPCQQKMTNGSHSNGTIEYGDDGDDENDDDLDIDDI